ncbi:MAG: RNase P subunit p30 family protein [Candidatus Pacearchaeota archaeon]
MGNFKMDYLLIKGKDFQKIRKSIRENKKKRIIFLGESEELSKKVLEKEKIDVLLINLVGRKDKQKQRDSGFDTVLAKLAKKNNVRIGINLDEILYSKNMEKAAILGRVRQNIKVCNKNNLNMVFISKERRNLHDLKSLGIILGMPTKMTAKLELIKLKEKTFSE